MSKKPQKKKQQQKKKNASKKQKQVNTTPKASAQSKFTPWRFGRRYEITPDGRRILHKKKYVFEEKAKKALLIGFTIVIASIVLGSGAVIALNKMTRDAEDQALSEAARNETPVSLVGITAEGKDLIDNTGKYDDFLNAGNTTASSVYDSIITMEDANVLMSRNQLSSEGISDVMKEKSEAATESAYQ